MPPIPFTQKNMMDWAGATAFRDGQTLYERGLVQSVEFDPPYLRGTISWGNRSIKTAARVLKDSTCENLCPCRDSTERGIVCPHVIALGLALLRRVHDPERDLKRLEEERRAARLEALDESNYIRRAKPDEEGARSGLLRLELGRSWREAVATGRLPLLAFLDIEGRRLPLDQVPRDLPVQLTQKDESTLFVLEDMSGGPARGRLEVSVRDLLNLLELCAGKSLHEEGEERAFTVNAAPMTSTIRLDLDRENGELLLNLHTELPFVRAGEFPIYLVAGRRGWVFGGGHFWPLKNLLPDPLRPVYLQPAVIPRAAVPRFWKEEYPVLANLMTVETELSADLFSLDPAAPGFRLSVRGSPASLSAVLYAQYNGIALVAGKSDPQGHFALPDPTDLLRYTVRNPEAEQDALRRLERHGFKGETGDGLSSIVGCREVMNFLGSSLPLLRRRGWKVDFEGKVSGFLEAADYVTPVVQIADSAAGDWFEVAFDFDDGKGGSLTATEVQRALRKNESFLEKNGRTYLLDADAIRTMQDIFSDCEALEGGQPGTFRLGRVYASYIKSSLDALDGIDVEASPQWRRAAEQQNRETTIEEVRLSEPLNTILRSYQREGVRWLRFLETHALSGILADEMGLGKTLQTLAWIQLRRYHDLANGRPSLIVCPTSLVENWAEEAQRFVPNLRVLAVTGSDRHEKWASIAASDIVITSYALLRRDIERYQAHEFGVAALDEAQHIKNRSTQNAMAAKRIRALHRLVLTGTPIENSVADLWSIMDFLMPDYLGSHESFKRRYETPIAQAGAEGEAAQTRLRRKLHPFLLRRLKKDVAKDLPPKIERTAFCSLTVDQQRVYRELLESSRRRVGDLVAEQGFQRARLEILTILMRLRQVCCHLELLKMDDLKSEYPSAKLDLFFELMDEALDAGHRVLVFSQFVSMLTILRREFEQRGLTYCYLDGSTRERMQVVHTFNTDRAIPAFLISLKAGGVGLNLTGADMVVHFDPWWNPAVENQATDRAYRIGQKRTVYCVKLIARDTIEEKVLVLQKRKKAIIDATLETDEQVMGALSWDDVRELLME